MRSRLRQKLPLKWKAMAPNRCPASARLGFESDAKVYAKSMLLAILMGRTYKYIYIFKLYIYDFI